MIGRRAEVGQGVADPGGVDGPRVVGQAAIASGRIGRCAGAPGGRAHAGGGGARQGSALCRRVAAGVVFLHLN